MEDYKTLDFDISPTEQAGWRTWTSTTGFGQVFSDHMFVMDFEDRMEER